VPGGDTVQISNTAKCLNQSGVETKICLTAEKINYQDYDLLHFFNITRPADVLFHIKKSGKPFVITPNLVDYSEYDKLYRKGISGFIFRMLSADTNEYLKTILRWITGKDGLRSKKYLWKGHHKCVREILMKAAMILPNSNTEYEVLKKKFSTNDDYSIIPNGIDESFFTSDADEIKDEKLVLCAARIEGIKNQLNLIKALNNTEYKLMIIGDAAPNQKKYYYECRKIAAENIVFTDRLSQHALADHYKKAKVHVLPSWFETCGLSSLEAAFMGCNIVITDKGFTRDYFGDDAFYCDPGKIDSIFSAVEKASQSVVEEKFQKKISENYTWRIAAKKTFEAYKKILAKQWKN
jgi:glycosyltransferase involved in cell wall biosynthesis